MTTRLSRISPLTVYYICAILTVFLIFPFSCLSFEQRSIDRTIDPITISGFEARALFGVKISNIRAIGSRNGELYPMPFQIDQKDSSNEWVWDSVEDMGAKASKAPFAYDDQDPVDKRIFDANDVIVLMANDAGDKDRESVMQGSADKLVEIEITDPVDNRKGWAYIAHYESDAPDLSDVRYVHFDPDNLLVTATNHEFKYSPIHIMVLEAVKMDGVSIIEGNRIRGEVSVSVGPLPISFDFNEKSFKGYTYGHIEGPIRVIKRSIENVQLHMGVSSPPANCDHYHYAWHAETPILISKRPPIRKVSFLATSVLQSGAFNRVETGTSWIGLNGSKFSVENSIKIPEKHKNHIDVTLHLEGTERITAPLNSKKHYVFEAGFKISTNDQTPDGDHIVHSVIVFSSNPKSGTQPSRAIEMLENPLVLKTFTLKH